MRQTLIVSDELTTLNAFGINAISFQDYLKEFPKLNEPKTRVINLCDTHRYLSQGYYCSLLAEARDHSVLPSIRVINELRDGGRLLTLPRKLADVPVEEGRSWFICMGESENGPLSKLSLWIYQQYPSPILMAKLMVKEDQLFVTVNRASFSELQKDEQEFCGRTLKSFEQRSWKKQPTKKPHRWDMAILIDPDEAVPPSDKRAVGKFIEAADKLGLHAETITSNDFSSLAKYDALFIRETTAIDHHTYRFAIEAEKLGLVVIDDAASILRCCNKVFLHDAFSYQGVPSPKTLIRSDAVPKTLDKIEQEVGYPVILKLPEGSFSRGVFKAKDRQDLEKYTADILSQSALYIAQEYMLTDFDWRIGVLNGRALYACRYFMAKGHWQIYNHSSKRNFSGGFDCLPTFEVPNHVLKCALKAAKTVGNSLYGIDIKEVDGKAYVLEVNDNPSLEAGIEDKYLGDELYMQIMAEFVRRLESRGKQSV